MKKNVGMNGLIIHLGIQPKHDSCTKLCKSKFMLYLIVLWQIVPLIEHTQLLITEGLCSQ